MKKRGHSGRKQGYAVDARKQRRTPSQRRARGNLGRLSRMWNELTEDQRTAWRHRAGDVRSRIRMARSYPLDGQKFSNKINSVLVLLVREPRTDPPPDPKFGPNPVGTLQITGAGGALAIKLGVRGSPAEEVMVFASPPYSAGRAYCGDCRFLGLLPPSFEGFSDITRLYLKKFGVPPPNSRIFIRAWQEVNGWECKGQMHLANALVPPRASAAASQPIARAGGKRDKNKSTVRLCPACLALVSRLRGQLR